MQPDIEKIWFTICEDFPAANQSLVKKIKTLVAWTSDSAILIYDRHAVALMQGEMRLNNYFSRCILIPLLS
jgi:hypothetical protein